ncbi:multidrug efflux RND transporter permease subunit [Undibacterium sp. RTI2.1]|uniref:efflux RND transporter permease subunit n=1 Tax=unclassified Undibacterium TaxID=2630295 RepID=UPI002AB46AC5|nr:MULTISPECIES: multidrug efflux RND transporter permease subunit [unclassified Undibacterium]MDY7536935.1 multidrug efflux RND transporter permease subunit [Undibacterium sp. 5I1]MEB0032745.1 multidrug efflux RND transporter permease subunit [Undibacterium sp. RTI2.1]MEB0117968.1 multidrug efflux RND transporter permease subunit [Undibacterium sp. RTI2.2]MEB0232753.1 multidrug efflux RND transporter permease subunit [Undibacterium sp. 10I3]MEB0258886.1 multidrug efflux RND transporter permea
MFSKFFINRPIFATVLSLIIVLAGLAALRVLPISRYPEISPPVVNVTANYPGASAEVVERTVAAPIEEQINGVEHMLYMSSTSSADGRVSIDVTFEVGTDLDIAAVNVNNRVRQADAKLPQEVRRQGVTVSKSSSNFLVVAALYSPDNRYDSLYLSNYATQNVLDALKRVPGTTNIQIFGAKDYAMRIWMRPDRMAQLGVTVSDISNAVGEQNAQYAAGKVGAPPNNTEELTMTVTAKGRLLEPAEFANIIVKTDKSGASVRIKDVARVELGSKDYNLNGRVNGHPSANIGVFLQTGANALDTRKAIEATLQDLKSKFPEGMEYATPYDTTPFVTESIAEVLKTLGEAMVLVFIVVYLFLQSWRATIIPTLAVPVSLIGTMAGLHLLGYSINTLTLFGMVLAIGIVVDDAIVVLENVERLMNEEGMTPKDAAIEAMHEVTGPVIAIVLVLVAAFGPIAFLGGLAGELYRQFSVTISIAVVLSGIVALTLTPALCAILLKPGAEQHNRFFTWFNGAFLRLTKRYTNGVTFFLRRSVLGVMVFGGMLVVTGVLWKTVPGGLVPDEDQGYFIGAAIMPEGTSLARTDAMVKQVEEIMKTNKNIDTTFALVGLDFLGGGGLKSSAATMFFPLKPWDERTQSAQQMVGESFMKTGRIKEGLPLFFSPPAIQGLGQTGGFEFYMQNKGEGGVERLAKLLPALLAEANKQPELAGVQTLWQANSPQLYVDVDNDKARSMGVALSDVYNTLAATMGSYYVNDFNKNGRTYTVQLQAEGQFRAKPDDIGSMYVRSATGQMIPVRAFTTIRFTTGPDSVQRFNALPSIKILGGAKPGYSSGQAIAAMERAAKTVLPVDVSYDWGGASFQEKRTSNAAGIAIGAGVLMIFLILAAQYEKWSLPFSVLLAMPFGIFGALLAVYLRNFNNDVYFQIGLVTLLGLSAKNAILIVEFAVMKVHEGYAPVAAVLESARLRFRPILMTSLAFILGVVPLAFSHGAGAAARMSLGTGVLGGMLAATFLAIFFVPLFFKLINDKRFKTTEEDFEHPVHILHNAPPAELKN